MRLNKRNKRVDNKINILSYSISDKPTHTMFINADLNGDHPFCNSHLSVHTDSLKNVKVFKKAVIWLRRVSVLYVRRTERYDGKESEKKTT